MEHFTLPPDAEEIGLKGRTFRPDGEPPYGPDHEAEPLPFVGFEDISINVAKASLIKGVIAKRETSSWIGGPGKFKSGLLTDIAVHGAAGLDWRGHKTKERFGVVYIAFERGDLLKRRLEAYRRKHDLKDLPIAVVTAAVDLMSAASVGILTATINAIAARYGIAVGLLILDTFAKAIAVGGGDEDKAKDQNRVLGHLRRVQGQTDVHIALVGHTGKDETRGARGSNAHLGDVDLMVQFSGDTIRAATVTKANDQPEGVLTKFTVETFDFGQDEDGDPITTAIVSAVVPEATEKDTSKRTLTDRQEIALNALDEAVIVHGRPPPGMMQLPKAIRLVVDAAKWKEELFTFGVLDRDAANPRKEFQRVRESLFSRRLIGFRDDVVWKVNP